MAPTQVTVLKSHRWLKALCRAAWQFIGLLRDVFPLLLAEDHHARLSSVFAPHIGHPHSEDLDSEYLNIFETRTRTPFFQDVYVDGVRVMLIIGPTGTGKSVHGNNLIAFEQKHGRFTYIFDIAAARRVSSNWTAAELTRTAHGEPIHPWSRPTATSSSCTRS